MRRRQKRIIQCIRVGLTFYCTTFASEVRKKQLYFPLSELFTSYFNSNKMTQRQYEILINLMKIQNFSFKISLGSKIHSKNTYNQLFMAKATDAIIFTSSLKLTIDQFPTLEPRGRNEDFQRQRFQNGSVIFLIFLLSDHVMK